MKKYKDYTAMQIEDYGNKHNYMLQEFGGFNIGSSFMVLCHNEKDSVISFVMTGHNDNGSIFTCIYADV